jgi:hypothetical protein
MSQPSACAIKTTLSHTPHHICMMWHTGMLVWITQNREDLRVMLVILAAGGAFKMKSIQMVIILDL